MGKTISEKILSAKSGLDLKAGDIAWINVDKAMLDDILGPRVQIAEHLPKLSTGIKDVDNVVVISDHYTPPATIKQAEIVKFTRDWSKEQGIKNYYEFKGPCHQVMAEEGHVVPGTVVLGTDSHTCMGGALGAFASGVGSTEMLGIISQGKTWLKVPETILVEWSGELPEYVMAKDMVLHTIKHIGHAGATYKAIEFVGSAIEALSVDQRMAITNMAVEMGAKVGLMNVDDKVKAYLHEKGIDEFDSYQSDPDATYCQVLKFDASTLTAQVACPHEVDNVHDADTIKAKAIDQFYLGSCTGGRYSDLEMAANIMKGKKIADGVRFLVSPASQSIWEKSSEAGILGILAKAGATILAPTCGVCVGLHSGLLGANERCLSTSNRNFIGRMGSTEAEIYLASPATVAISALTGVITDPSKIAKMEKSA
ncbi:3-isopropylmalate dehydratase large subunit [Vibrio vulnificus]|uniref:3-isopropylmalate dehydratase large subunit n=1 Tax=Vibrio vulnificus TaxID=672 RepID=UPI001A275534|nr:homoaconitate hydratase family protein [Vibrio vulnificus]HAS6036921.1 homoaconitate hydratase family protein [Vibrio vulnificus]HDY7951848.1 3-isopropylmalate dehydratase large subunit [Vibrio vulnificus]